MTTLENIKPPSMEKPPSTCVLVSVPVPVTEDDLDNERGPKQQDRIAALPYKWDSLIDAPCLCVSATQNDDLPVWPLESVPSVPSVSPAAAPDPDPDPDPAPSLAVAAATATVNGDNDNFDRMPIGQTSTSGSDLDKIVLRNQPPPPPPTSLVKRGRSTLVQTFVNDKEKCSIEMIGDQALNIKPAVAAPGPLGTAATKTLPAAPIGTSAAKTLPAILTGEAGDKKSSLLSPTTIALITKESGDHSDMAYYTEASSIMEVPPPGKSQHAQKGVAASVFGPTRARTADHLGGPEAVAAGRTRSVPIVPTSRHNPRASPVSESLVFDDLFAGMDETDQEVAQYAEKVFDKAVGRKKSTSASSDVKHHSKIAFTKHHKGASTKHSKSAAGKHSKNSSNKHFNSTSERHSRSTFGKQLKTPSENHRPRTTTPDDYHHHHPKKSSTNKKNKQLQEEQTDKKEEVLDLDDPKKAMEALRELKNNSPLLISKMNQLHSVLKALKKEKKEKMKQKQYFSVRQRLAEDPYMKSDAQRLYSMLEEILHSDHEASDSDSGSEYGDSSLGSYGSAHDDLSMYSTGFIDQIRNTNFLAPMQKAFKTVYKSVYRSEKKPRHVVRTVSSVSYSAAEEEENRKRAKKKPAKKKKHKKTERTRGGFKGNIFDFIANELGAAVISSQSSGWSSDEETYDDKINKTISFRSRQSSNSRQSRQARPPTKRSRRSRAASRGRRHKGRR